MAVLIFANGEMVNTEWIRPYLENATAVIAADGGARHLFALGWLPDLVIGDMDSIPDEVRAWLETADTPLELHPAAKDATDLELALLYAAESYDDDILLFGMLGGRLDHTLANVFLLAHPALAGRRVQFVTPRERAWLVAGQTHIEGNVGDVVSLIPLGGDVEVESAAGLQWPLKDEVLAFGPARGVSNVMTAELATVSVRSGYLLCIQLNET